MKLFMLGAVIGVGLILSTTAFAATLKGLQLVTNVQIGNQVITKYMDKDTETVCYTFNIGNAPGGISCVK